MADCLSTNCATQQSVVFGLSDRGLQRANNEDHFMAVDLSRKLHTVRPVPERIIRAVDMAHAAICTYHSASGRTRHMRSTLTAVHVGQGAVTITQVGDSRA